MKTGTGSTTACAVARSKPLLVVVPVPVFIEFSSAQGRSPSAAHAQQGYILRLLEQRHDWQAGPEPRERLLREGETLQALKRSDFPQATPEFICFVLDDESQDLAIVSRGSRNVHGVKGGVEVLLEEYSTVGGRPIELTDVRVHELLLALGWLEESWREYQKPDACGHGPDFYENQLRSLYRRAAR